MKNAVDLFRMQAAAMVWSFRMILSAFDFFAAMRKASEVKQAEDGAPLMAVLFGAENVKFLTTELEWYNLRIKILTDDGAPAFYREAFVDTMRNQLTETPADVLKRWERQVEKGVKEWGRIKQHRA